MADQIPPTAVSLIDYQQLANEKLDRPSLAYLEGGAADQHSSEANIKAWASATIWPRVMTQARGATTQTSLLGLKLDSPLMIAPTAYHRLFHEQGELATATAASALNTPYIVSTQASTPLEEIAAQAAGSPLWFQLYIQHDREFTADLVLRAKRAGFQALVLTVDAPVNGIRNHEQRAGFQLPPGISSVNLHGMRPAPSMSHALDPRLLSSLPNWQDIAWLKELSGLPVIIKGILHPQDALLAMEHGADAIIVSNHGGRTLDLLPPTKTALPLVAQAIDKQIPILVDGGIRRGTDVLQAIALGADAVLLGRPILHGLSVAGATGVAHVLRLLQHELEVAMLLTGCRSLTEASSVINTPN
ncbi:4-hydroxymandelate oxidase [Rubritalea halochordaticola]|uniref:4-hydroxymandelate oxidase n=1 Tax=Rubritalea halochordaticola TaxID=714537 RepID=A0ABP9V009_9BACT